MHFIGDAVKTCTMFAAEAIGAEVSTIDGSANADESLNLFQQAFQDHHDLRRGFCTSGMAMSMAARLSQIPQPDER